MQKRKIYQLYENPTRILSEGDPKFGNAAFKDYATTASINWKIISAYSSRGNAKVERMIRTFKRAVQKVLISNKDQDWDEHLGEVLAGYPRRSGTDGESTFEIQSGIRPRFAIGPPQLDLVAFNTDLAREFEVAVAKFARVSRIVPRATERWTKKFDLGQKLTVRRGKKERDSKIESINRFGPLTVKEKNHPRYQLRTDGCRKFRRPTHARRLKTYVERDYGLNAGTICWHRNFPANSLKAKEKN